MTLVRTRGPASRRRCATCVATGVPAGSVFTQPVQPNNTVPVVTGGNPDLQEEASDTWTAGVVITPIDSLYMSIDFFDITLDGAIAPIGGGAQNTLNLCYLTLQDRQQRFLSGRGTQSGHGRDHHTVTPCTSARRISAHCRRRASTSTPRMAGTPGFGMEAPAASNSALCGPGRRRSR